MRGHLQQVSSKLVATLLVAVATAVYLLTLDRSVSWWDCGEFIATGLLLEVGHPPGAPLYQLLSHLFMLLSMGHSQWVAPLSNAFSALCGGLTVGLLFLTAVELGATRRGAVVGALCYLFSDTAWFSAVESEVYSLAVCLAALEVWLMLCWRRTRSHRLLPLVSLLVGLGVCVHLLTLLVLPALLLIFISCQRPLGWRLARQWCRRLPLMAFFLTLGLTPYLIIPIRAAAHPPINEGDPSTPSAFASYLRRDQYVHAPLYPRMWRERDSLNHREWSGGLEGVAGNAVYYATYQAGYMYGRYLMYNFIGRENLKHRRVVLFVVPFLLGLWGLWLQHRRRRTDWWTVLLLFLFGGLLLNLYLNHPCYEPRERDYAYVLSFYAFALWIGIGAGEALRRPRLSGRRWHGIVATLLVLAAPASLAAGNWSDHDRHRCHSVHDIALNHLQSCDPGALLITLGDNDTFPLWYLQQVEHRRQDVEVCNINLNGFASTLSLASRSLGRRPVYLSQYCYDRYAALFPGSLRCEGYCWRLLPVGTAADTSDLALRRHLRDSVRWHIVPGEYLDPVSLSFLRLWEQNTGVQVGR